MLFCFRFRFLTTEYAKSSCHQVILRDGNHRRMICIRVGWRSSEDKGVPFAFVRAELPSKFSFLLGAERMTCFGVLRGVPARVGGL